MNNSLYMAWMDTGASDHFTKMEENEIAVMPIKSGIATGIGGFCGFMMVKSLTFRVLLENAYYIVRRLIAAI